MFVRSPRRVADLHAHLLDRFEARDESRAVEDVDDRHSVEHVGVVAPRPAAERDQRGVRLILLAHEPGITSGHHHRCRRGRDEDVASGTRPGVEAVRVDQRADRGGGRGWRVIGNDGDRLLQAPHLQGHVNRDERLRREAKVRALVGLVAVHRHANRVTARPHVGELIFAAARRRRAANQAGVLVRQLDGRDWHDAVGVVDDAADASLEILRGQWRRGDRQQREEKLHA